MKMAKSFFGRDPVSRSFWLNVLLHLLVFPMALVAQTISLPQLPLHIVDTRFEMPADGTTWLVNAGENLQATFDSAQPGDIIQLQAGAIFSGNFVVGPKQGEGWIYVVSSALAELPPEGTRVSPANAAKMPKLISPNQFNPALIVQEGASQLRFVGIEISTAYRERTGVQYGVLRIGWRGSAPAANRSDQIIFDRSYIHGTPDGNIRDGIQTYNVSNLAIIDSYISDFHGVGYESHAVHIYNSPGPTKIKNNYIEGAGINLFIGDSDLGGGSIPQDIEVIGNYLFKPWSWKADHPDYAGIPWLVKNLLEIKAGQRILIQGNIMENVWVGAQHGQVLVITPRAALIEDVTIRNNLLRNFQGGMNINSADVSLERISVEHNIFHAGWEQSATMAAIAGTPGKLNQIAINNNAFVAQTTSGAWLMFNGSRTDEVNQIQAHNNLVVHGLYGIFGNGLGVGLKPVQYYCTGYSFRRNALIGGTASWYLFDDHFLEFFFPADISSVGFDNCQLSQIADFRLLPDSPYKNGGTDGRDLGPDIDKLLATTACATSGACKAEAAPKSPQNLRLATPFKGREVKDDIL